MGNFNINLLRFESCAIANNFMLSPHFFFFYLITPDEIPREILSLLINKAHTHFQSKSSDMVAPFYQTHQKVP